MKEPTESELRLVAYIMRFCGQPTVDGKHLVYDSREVADVLEETYGYDEYEATPLVWDTMDIIGERHLE